ncbi:MAG: tetratricopeptide repeat protein [Thermodesulfobacteriota bacterium]
MGVAYSRKEKCEEALQAFNKGLEIDPGDALALKFKSMVLKKLGRDK